VDDAWIKMWPSRNGDWPMRLYRSIVALTIGLSAVACLGIGAAYSHDPKRPELNAWFKSLKNKVGEPCCDTGDGQHAVVEWDMARRGYKVLLKNPQRPDQSGQWFDVPYAVVIERPNLSGMAMVWWWPIYDTDGTMTPRWRCFIAGAGG
jgi:hypothetical protein